MALRKENTKLRQERIATKNEKLKFEKLKFEHKKMREKRKDEQMKLLEVEEERLRVVMERKTLAEEQSRSYHLWAAGAGLG